MFKRAVRNAVARGTVTADVIAHATDGSIMSTLVAGDPSGLAAAVEARRLYKRAIDLPASDVPSGAQTWVSEDPDLLAEVEDGMALALGLHPGEVLLDYPSKPAMLSVDLPLQTRAGAVERLTDQGRAGQLGLPRVAEELYRSARRLRIFTMERPQKPVKGALDIITMGANEVREKLRRGERLL
jgi:hypothetical protein